ncbi:hypothetical protein [Thalassospira sp. ER-Se-21-Dark]|uniref:hypothetical protein n=1 Tax=Thalassospira sp. ER-Se-21-Dark TaxID=2585190 RepID=UPI001B30CC97|nr:hypothetical protein [Thalassospira sp. ER-Se-21-Dark]
MAEKKRAIALAGGGPAVGLRIGALKRVRLNPDFDEVWGSRILDIKQIRQPENLYDALNDQVMLFAATTSEDDVKLFTCKVAESGRDIRGIEIPVEANISYDWTWENLDQSIEDGNRAANSVLSAYRNTTGDVTVAKLLAASNDAA